MAEAEDCGSASKKPRIEEGNSNHHLKCETSQDEENSSTAKDKPSQSVITGFPAIVAGFYNSVEKLNFEDRQKSRIYYLRNLNNWVKCNLIMTGVNLLPEETKRKLVILDLCCGKGGDLFKWKELRARYVVCADIAENNIKQYKTRYKVHVENNERNRSLECEFIVADCTKERLRKKYKDPSMRFNAVSCQFSFHYCFESLPQVECMLKNVTECLKLGGIFMGTILNAYEIVKRVKESKSDSVKNSIYSIEMYCSEPYPLFGAKYNFHLEGVVDCPEFLVHFPTFVKLAEKYGLQLICNETFPDLFKKEKNTRYGSVTLRRIRALETYPPEGGKLNGQKEDYLHAENYCEANNVKKVGTLSKPEWEVFSLYQTFIFRKIREKN